eukprot:gb/GEZN01015840.1/.p1 GENE.gb/GEZN01015840.1/~~gb/GEZN01015840.1/.p1  ORF type:complete len:197 (-),score=6.17 gb/GEZN01015840.1/:231-821(-)
MPLRYLEQPGAVEALGRTQRHRAHSENARPAKKRKRCSDDQKQLATPVSLAPLDQSLGAKQLFSDKPLIDSISRQGLKDRSHPIHALHKTPDASDRPDATLRPADATLAGIIEPDSANKIRTHLSPNCFLHADTDDPTASRSLLSEAPMSFMFCEASGCDAHDAVLTFKNKAAKFSETSLNNWWYGACSLGLCKQD